MEVKREIGSHQDRLFSPREDRIDAVVGDERTVVVGDFGDRSVRFKRGSNGNLNVWISDRFHVVRSVPDTRSRLPAN